MRREGEDRAAEVIAALAASKRGPLKSKELARALRVPSREYRAFRRLLTSLEKAGRIRRVKGHRYQLDGKSDLVVGVLSLTRRGDGFVQPDGGGPDVFVPASALDTAMEEDHVAVRIEDRPRARSPVGTVVDVLERARETVVGTFHQAKKHGYVVAMDVRFAGDVRLTDPAHDAEPGDVVVVRLLTYGGRGLPATGTVERVLGPLSGPGVDVLAVAYGFGLPLDFPRGVVEAAERAAELYGSDPGPERVDRTDLLAFTIDPSDAKDHDDALSITRVDDGSVEIGVHIADVSHFVRPFDDVDSEALARGTSVYLVDRAIPMLPSVLSSDLCSLQRERPRFAVSLFATLDAEGRVRERRYERTLIRCRYALSYEEAQAVLAGEVGIAPDLDRALRHLDDHARRLRAARRERGALDLDIAESKVILDDEGLPIDIQRRERLASHRLVEDYMLLANEVVANDLLALGHEGLYRVHEPPTAERVEELAEALSPLGIPVPRRKTLKPRDVQRILDAARGAEEKSLVSSLVLRTLKRARYDTENLGHFGLASTGYTHFTSPIRRYPDLVVHRLVVAAFLGGEPLSPEDRARLGAVAEQSSAREQAADEAERATIELKKVEFMQRHLGEEFVGRITGVTSFGFFVTLEEYFVEGLVHVRSKTTIIGSARGSSRWWESGQADATVWETA